MKSPATAHFRRGRCGSSKQDRISMTPMIDIVFLLIIFFLVSSHLSRQETRHPVSLSQAGTGAPADSQPASVTLTVDDSLRLYFAGILIRPDELRGRMSAWIESREPSAANRGISVRLRIDRSVPYGSVEPILKELATLSITNIAIVVNPRSNPSFPSEARVQ